MNHVDPFLRFLPRSFWTRNRAWTEHEVIGFLTCRLVCPWERKWCRYKCSDRRWARTMASWPWWPQKSWKLDPPSPRCSNKFLLLSASPRTLAAIPSSTNRSMALLFGSWPSEQVCFSAERWCFWSSYRSPWFDFLQQLWPSGNKTSLIDLDLVVSFKPSGDWKPALQLVVWLRPFAWKGFESTSR